MAPRYLKVRRTGSSFTGYYSSDGMTWLQIGTSVSINGLPSSLRFGLAVCSHKNDTLNTATFDHVSVIS